MINEAKLIGRKIKNCRFFDTTSDFFLLTMGMAIIGGIVLITVGIYYFIQVPVYTERQAYWDTINSYECAELEQWLRSHWGSEWFETFHNKWVMHC